MLLGTSDFDNNFKDKFNVWDSVKNHLVENNDKTFVKKGISARDCARECSNTHRCTAWQWSEPSKSCFLLSKEGTQITDNGNYAGSLGDAIDLSPYKGRFYDWTDVSKTALNSGKPTPTSSANKCYEQCALNQKCRSWEWQPSGKCYTFSNSTLPPTPDPEASGNYAMLLRPEVQTSDDSKTVTLTCDSNDTCQCPTGNDMRYTNAKTKKYVAGNFAANKNSKCYANMFGLYDFNPFWGKKNVCECHQSKKQIEAAATEKKEEAKDDIAIALTNANIGNLNTQINALQAQSSALKSNISMTSQQITQNQNKLNKQIADLEQKRAVLITRNRMLQLSQDRNVYKQKVIYTLISLIIVCFVLIIIGYIGFKKLYSM